MKTLLKVLLLKSSKSNSSAGFTLMEMLAVLVIVGILAAIAGPSWAAFMNTRRATDSASVLLESFRVTQSDAAKSRRPHTIEFNPSDSDPPVVRTGRTNGTENERTNQRLGGVDTNPGLIALTTVDANGTTVDEIRFTGQGNLDTDFLQDEGYDLPIYLTVIVPSPELNPNGKKRCVVIETILGAARNATDDDCKS